MSSVRPRALVVDDDEAIRQMISRVLERDGFDVDSARDGQDAIDQLNSGDYHFVVLDLMMPRVDGFGVLNYLKAHCPDRLRSVIVATAMYSEDLSREPVAGILRKPFDLGDLRHHARRVVSLPEATGSPA